jgi:hypothetical protein
LGELAYSLKAHEIRHQFQKRIDFKTDNSSLDKKLMLAGLNLWKKSLLRMRNPQKLLEKSKNLEPNLRDFWS